MSLCKVHGCWSQWRAGHTEWCLHEELDCHISKSVVGMGCHIAVRDQLVAIPKVPNEVHCISCLQIAAWVVDLDIENHIWPSDKDVFVSYAVWILLGNVHGEWNLIWMKKNVKNVINKYGKGLYIYIYIYILHTHTYVHTITSQEFDIIWMIFIKKKKNWGL